MKNAFFLSLVLFAFAFAQENSQDRNISIGGSIGYARSVLDELKDYPFEGLRFGFGTSGFIPLTDETKFGIDISISYATVSATGENNATLAISVLDLNLVPKIRFGEKKIYTNIGFYISIPLSEEATLKRSGYKTITEKNNNSETSYALSLEGRYNVIGLGISKDLTGSNKAVGLNGSAFLSVTEKIEINPFITYYIGDLSEQVNLGIGFDYWL